MQDELTFDNASNNLITAFDHELALDDIILLHTYTGTLPPELSQNTRYYVVSITATTFQVSLDKGGSPINFTTDGVGILYYRHDTGVGRSNVVISTSVEDVKVSIGGWIALRNADGTDNAMRAVIMSVDTSGNIVEDQVGSFITADNTKPSSSVLIDNVTLKNGEGIALNIRNDSNTDNILAEEIIFIISKV